MEGYAEQLEVRQKRDGGLLPFHWDGRHVSVGC